MTLSELKRQLKQIISLHENMKLTWGFNIFTFKINYLCVDVDYGESCYIIQKKKTEYQIIFSLRNNKHYIASFDEFLDSSSENQACEYFYHWVMVNISESKVSDMRMEE